MDTIFIQALKVEASIGVFEWEKQVRQSLIFDLELEYDFKVAGQTDDVQDTVCYATVSEQVIRVVESQHFELLEALGEKITRSLLDTFPIQALQLRISKPGAVPQAQNVGIQLYRQKT